jgi:hypothetical protein
MASWKLPLRLVTEVVAVSAIGAAVGVIVNAAYYRLCADYYYLPLRLYIYNNPEAQVLAAGAGIGSLVGGSFAVLYAVVRRWRGPDCETLPVSVYRGVVAAMAAACGFGILSLLVTDSAASAAPPDAGDEVYRFNFILWSIWGWLVGPAASILLPLLRRRLSCGHDAADDAAIPGA